MKKSALLRRVAATTDLPYSTVKRVMDVAFDEIVDRLQHGERVVLSGFGTFALRPYKARTWVNPQTNRPVEIPAALRPGFITSAALKRRLADAPISPSPGRRWDPRRWRGPGCPAASPCPVERHRTVDAGARPRTRRAWLRSRRSPRPPRPWRRLIAGGPPALPAR